MRPYSVQPALITPSFRPMAQPNTRFGLVHRIEGADAYVLGRISALTAERPVSVYTAVHDDDVPGGMMGVVLDGTDMLTFTRQHFNITLDQQIVGLDRKAIEHRHPKQWRMLLRLFRRMETRGQSVVGNLIVDYLEALEKISQPPPFSSMPAALPGLPGTNFATGTDRIIYHSIRNN